jgi:hypothetical protein
LEYQTAYRIAVHRAARRGQTELYPISLRQPLPAIRIPLRPDDQDVPLDLQTVIEQVWRNGRYDLTDYGIWPSARCGQDVRGPSGKELGLKIRLRPVDRGP